MLGVAFSSEGDVIRKAGISVPILVMCQESYDHLPVLPENNLNGLLDYSKTQRDECEKIVNGGVNMYYLKDGFRHHIAKHCFGKFL